MESNSKRITLVARPNSKPDADWRQLPGDNESLLFAESLCALDFMLRKGMEEMQIDVERFVIDRAANDTEFLRLLVAIPEEFAGDVLHIRDDGSGFLSSVARNCGRVLYALSPSDVRFYLEANDLVTGRLMLDTRRIA